MPRCVSVSTSLNAFIAITVLQIVFFIFTPTLFGPVVEKAPEYLQIIGIKEISLMYLYYNIVQEKAPGLALMTVFGRLLTIPLMLYLVFIVHAPTDMLGGIVLDIIFGSWTLYSVMFDPEWNVNEPLKARNAGKHRRNFFSFLLLALIGLAETSAGALMFALPTQVLGSEYAKFFLPVANPTNMEHPFVPLRSYGLMTFLVGLYQVILAGFPALTPRMWSAIVRFHILFALLLPILSAILQKPDGLSFEIPLFHAAAGGLLVAYSSLRSDPPGTVSAAPVPGDSSDSDADADAEPEKRKTK